MTCNFTSFSTVFQSYQDNGREAGCFGSVFLDPVFFFGPVPYHLGGFGPILGASYFCPTLLGPFGPLYFFNNFIGNEKFFWFPGSISYLLL